MSERVCYRYRTAALCGPWRRQPETAHRDAISAGQIRPAGDEPTWRVNGEIEASYCDRGGPCGGQYPPDDDGSAELPPLATGEEPGAANRITIGPRSQ